MHINIKSHTLLALHFLHCSLQSDAELPGACLVPDFRVAAGLGIVDEAIFWPEEIFDQFSLVCRLIRFVLFVLG